MSLAETLALSSRRIEPAESLDGRRAEWGEAQLRRQLGESNGDPIPAPVALNVHVPAVPGPDAVRHLGWLKAQATRIGGLLDPDRVPQILNLEISDSRSLSTECLADLVEHLGTVFVRDRPTDWHCVAAVQSRSIAPEAVECLMACGVEGLVIRGGCVCTDKGACRGCVLCQGGRIRDPGGRFELILEVPIAEPSLTRPHLCAIAEAECTAKADRVIFIPPFTPRDTGARSQFEDYAAAYTRACRRLEAAGFRRRSPMEFAREDAIRSERPGPSWRPVSRHIGIGLGANAQSHVNDWIFLNEPDLDRFDRSLSRGGLGIVYGTFLTAEERLRLGIIYDLLTRGVIDLDVFGAQHAIGTARPLSKNSACLNDLVARGIVKTGTGNAIEFAPHAILHTAEICTALAYPPTPVRKR